MKECATDAVYDQEGFCLQSNPELQEKNPALSPSWRLHQDQYYYMITDLNILQQTRHHMIKLH